ncbi:hypothetical protein PMI01_03759 [Caulobacter sp. AP07]|uniref:WapI family immunity protein n=1 Tax=Caulobacter sp. AP07 TaxID=1144304 RepID=UPI00027201CC|nr:hypothetical protein [Caulobacter sp. AP07]EJL27632.1 hypothetical protein PMI01_03759 [Caulobacter sp. AP07]
MQDESSHDWIKFGDGQANVAVTLTETVGYGWPALARITLDTIMVERQPTLMNVADFVKAAEKMHSDLAGEAKLESLEGDFDLKLSANSLGRIAIEVTAHKWAGNSFEYDFRGKFEVDQSYLPSLIHGLRAQLKNRAST